MRFGKSILAEALNLQGNAFGKFGRDTAGGHTGPQLVLIALEIALAPPGGHGPPQFVGLARGKSGGDDGQLHDLFLKDGHAKGALQHLVDGRIDAFDRLPSLPPLEVGMHHVALDRARPNQRDFDDQIVKIARFQARQHGHLGARFDLKDAHAVGPAQHRVGCRVFGRNIGQPPWPAFLRSQHVQHAAQGREHA